MGRTQFQPDSTLENMDNQTPTSLSGGELGLWMHLGYYIQGMRMTVGGGQSGLIQTLVLATPVLGYFYLILANDKNPTVK